MDHLHIARVFDGGVKLGGHPFLAMEEYVEGVAITDYCDQAGLSLRERLEMFAEVCEAIQHAHRKGFLHRDLNPSNVLLCEPAGRAVPKGVDLGLAKAMLEPLMSAPMWHHWPPLCLATHRA